MIQVHHISQMKEKEVFFSQLDPLHHTWIVSDLRTKFYLQARLLEGSVGIHEESILRISDLWRLLLLRARPDLRIVSADLVRIYIRQYFAERMSVDRAWTQMPGAVDTAIHYLSQLLPVVSHPDGTEVLVEWLDKHPEAAARWGHWLGECRRIWGFIQGKKVVLSQWIPGVLVNCPGFENYWSRTLYFDVGAELKSHESALILNLGESVDVHVLSPGPRWRNAYPALFYPYFALSNLLEVEKLLDLPSEPGIEELVPRVSPVQIHRYATQVSEIKDAVAVLRRWLDEGATPDELAIVAPDVEAYWTVLREYLEVEGIPANKERMTSLQSFSDVAQWLSRLRLMASRVRSGDLELSLFGGQMAQISTLSVDKFKSYYAVVYDQSDLSRHRDVEALFAQTMDIQEFLSRDQFVVLSLKNWPQHGGLERLEKILRTLLSEISMNVELSITDWVDYLERTVSKMEIKIDGGQSHGIHVVGLMSAEELPVSRIMFVGLSEEALSQDTRSGLLLSDVSSIGLDTGFQLMAPESNKLQYQLHWVLESKRKETIVSFSETDIDGRLQAPSILWLMLDHWRCQQETQAWERLGKDSVAIERPKTMTLDAKPPSATRWDQIQQTAAIHLTELRAWSSAKLKGIERRVLEDTGGLKPMAFGAELVNRVSPTALESYWRCPFQFAAQKVFRLNDLPELDLDLDPRSRGLLLHRLFEQLTQEPMRFDYSQEELNGLIDQCRKDTELVNGDNRLWRGQRTRYLGLAQRFLQFEKSWKEQFPQSQILGREVPIRGFIRLADGELCGEEIFRREASSSDKDWMAFSGKIDRIDGNKDGQRVIIDYKSSFGTHTHHGSWLGQGQMQMSLYSMAVESNLLDSSNSHCRGEVLGAVYYSLRDMKRDRGFLQEKGVGVLYAEKLNRAKLSNEEKHSLFQDFRELTASIGQRIKEGQFSPSPKDEKTCSKCFGRDLCRFHRLN